MDGAPLMASLRTLHRSFSAGEITPELFGRVDLAQRQEGLALCRNFITLPHGPAVNRPGTEFVSATPTPGGVSSFTRVIPFSYNNTQTFCVEFGARYFRFHTNGATLLYSDGAAYNGATAYTIGNIANSAGVNYYCIAPTTGNAPPNATYWYAMPTAPNIYEIPHPFTLDALADVHYTQSADVMTLVHPSTPPVELRRYGATDWRVSAPSFNPPANPLTGITATATTGTGAVTYDYVVTAVLTAGLQETVASANATCTNDLTVSPNKNTVTWTDSSAAGTNIRYNIYKKSNGLYGYIGQASGTSFVDNNITADVSHTPPIADTVFASTNNYPAAVGYFQQRRIFAGTNLQPQNFWATRSATESDMSYHIPVLSDDRIAVRIAAREASAIRHIVPTAALLFLTATCEWVCNADGNGGVLTPASVNMVPRSYVGANNVTPVVVNNIVLYAAARGGHLRELSYSWQGGGYVSADVSLLAPHLFDYKNISDMAYARGPTPVLWAVSDDGRLLGMTYVPEQRVSAWHQHDTGIIGTERFESCCVVTENGEDMLYLVVRRSVGGQVLRYIERMHTRRFDTLADAFFVDCGATYSGAATNSVSGLTWLEGRTVSILADGAVCPQQVVTGGVVHLPAGITASKITVGLPITAQLQTLPIAAQVDGGMAQGRQKNVNRAWMRVYRSSGLSVGPDFSHLTPAKLRTTEPYGSPPNLVSDEFEIVTTPAWAASGQMCVQQSDPLPVDLASMTLEVALGA